MAKKRKSKTSEFDALEAEKPTSLPRAEIQNLIHALETKDSIPMLKSTILEWTSESEDENIVGSPSFLEDNSTLTTETKSIHETKKTTTHMQRNEYSSTGKLFGDIGVFLTELTDSYSQRYDSWEESTNSVLAILRKLHIITLENSQQLVSTIETFQEQINSGLDKFRVKREYVETISESNHTEVAHMLKKTLNLLALQIKEFKLKNILNQLISIYAK
jgi:hypothetical protein